MKKASEYRQHAQECRTLARNMTREEDREHLLKMAEHWDNLAVERERMLHAQDEAGLNGRADAPDATPGFQRLRRVVER